MDCPDTAPLFAAAARATAKHGADFTEYYHATYAGPLDHTAGQRRVTVHETELRRA